MVTKGELIEYIQNEGMSSAVSYFENKDESCQKAAHNAYRSKVDKIYSEYRSLSKNKGKPGHAERLTKFRSELTSFPQAGKPKKRKVDSIDLAPKSSFMETVSTLKDVSIDLATELDKHKIENKKLVEEVKNLKAKLKSQQQSKKKLLIRKETQLSKVHS